MRTFILPLLLLCAMFSRAQIQPTDTVLFDDFEYSTPSPHIDGAVVYHTTPQTFGPYSGTSHAYFNFINGVAAGSVAYDRVLADCPGPGSYTVSFWCKDLSNGPYAITVKFWQGSVLISTDTIESAVVGTSFYNYSKQIDADSSLRITIENTWVGGTGNYDVIFDALLVMVDNHFDSYKTGSNGIFFCYSDQDIHLHPYIRGGAGTTGTWSGPSTLGNGYLGTYSTLTNDTGTYNYQIINTVCPDSSISISVDISTVLDLGNDTTLCIGGSLVLQAGNFTEYQWNTSSTNASINVNAPGRYSVTTKYESSNIVTNGDFETGNVGFTTQYNPGTGGTWGLLSNEGTYGIGTNASSLHTNFVGIDHTTGSGNFFVANGSSTANTEVWCQNINVNPNLDYEFSAWVTSVENTNPAILQFSINSNLLGSPLTAPSATGSWVQFFSNWTSNATDTSARICIVNQNTIGSGNDFGIDDISFSTVCYSTDTITVRYDTISYATTDTFICKGSAKEIILDSSSGYTFTWLDDQTTSNTHIVDQEGIYRFIAADSICSDTFRFTVLEDAPEAAFSADTMSGFAPLEVHFTNESSNATSYWWLLGAQDTSSQESPTHIFTAEGEYTVMLIATSDLGCVDTSASTEIVVLLPCQLVIPTAFTPDNDQINDTWHLMGLDCYDNVDIKVYNRWGTLVYEGDNNWSGDGLPNASYYYIVKGTRVETGEEISESGTVTIVR